MTDWIRLNGMAFYGYHGVLAEERILGQRFVVDVELRCDLRQAGRTDDLGSTVNYVDVYRAVEEVVTGPPYSLIEAVAERIAARLLDEFHRLESVLVCVRKPQVPLAGAVLASCEACIERFRERGL